MNRIILLLVFAGVLFSCKKSQDRSCWKATGGLTTKEIMLDSYDKLYMGPHLKYRMVQDTVNKVVLIGGNNLVNFVETSITENLLTIKNNNKCNFLRSYDKIVMVEIHFVKLINILFEGTEEVVAVNTLNTDYLTLAIRDGVGTFNLNVNANSLHLVISHGWGNFNFNGTVDFLSMDIRSNGFGDAYGLNVNDSIHAISNSSEVFKINADNCLIRTQTFEKGDIYYKGIPTFIEHFSYGEGQLVNKN